MLLHTAVCLSLSAPFPLADVRPGICVRARRDLHVGQPNPRTTPRTCHSYSSTRQALPSTSAWEGMRSQRRDLGAGGRGTGGMAIEGALCLRRRRPESLQPCHICAIPSLNTNLVSLLQHPASRRRSWKGPLTSPDRQSAPFRPSVHTAGYHGRGESSRKHQPPLLCWA